MQVSSLLTIAVATLAIAAGGAAVAHADETLATGLRVPFAFIVGDTRRRPATMLSARRRPAAASWNRQRRWAARRVRADDSVG